MIGSLGYKQPELEMIERIDVWQVHGDGGNEREVGPVIAYCSTMAQAEQAAKGCGWYGGDGAVQNRAALRIEGQVWLLAERDPIDLDSVQAKRDAELREKTLASLSHEQRRVLGIVA